MKPKQSYSLTVLQVDQLKCSIIFSYCYFTGVPYQWETLLALFIEKTEPSELLRLFNKIAYSYPIYESLWLSVLYMINKTRKFNIDYGTWSSIW